MSQLSAFGVNLTPPNPIQYTIPKNVGDIKSVLGSVNTAQNQANVANNDRYKQLLGVLQGGYSQAGQQLSNGYGSALGSLSNSLGNNQTVYNNDAQRATQDAVKAASSAQQSGISRGLGNTTIMNSMADQVQRSKNDAMANLAAQKAKSDNEVYNNIANIYQNKANAGAGMTAQQTGALGNAIQSRNDVGPSISDYAGLISNAAAAQNSNGKTVTTTVDPIPINSPLRTGGGGGGGISGGIGASMGQGGFTAQSGMGSGGGTSSSGAAYYGPGYGTNTNSPGGGFIDSLPGGGAMAGGGTSTPPVGPISGTLAGTQSEVPSPTAGAGGGGAGIQSGATGIYGMDGKLYGWRNPDGSIVNNPASSGTA